MSVVSAEASLAWAIVFTDSGGIAQAPAGSKHARSVNARKVAEKYPKSAPKRHRRTDAELIRRVVELRMRGVLPTAIADAENIGDRRVKEILRNHLAAAA